MSDGKQDRPGRATLFVGHLTLEKLLELPDGMRVTGVSHDFARLGVLLAVESDRVPALEEGTTPVNLGHLVLESRTDEAGETWHRFLLDPTS